jgi:hypothetical protein
MPGACQDGAEVGPSLLPFILKGSGPLDECRSVVNYPSQPERNRTLVDVSERQAKASSGPLDSEVARLDREGHRLDEKSLLSLEK